MQALAANAFVRCAFAGESQGPPPPPLSRSAGIPMTTSYFGCLHLLMTISFLLHVAAFPLFGTQMYEKLGDQVSVIGKLTLLLTMHSVHFQDC